MSGTKCVMPTDKAILDWSGLPRNAILTRCPPIAGSASLQRLDNVVYVVDNVRVKPRCLSILASVVTYRATQIQMYWNQVYH